ncbi:uncharacterized protein LOC133356194 [Lethenteron reissneri]|uniref:uncharacterized protein LOC133356194 n=1 Tax=Lethenteron reissneri TaxID=7753 RepID=UPI002AB5F176|nr:uncharacterized protein LOC133356194 [Lethenteron reissneri]
MPTPQNPSRAPDAPLGSDTGLQDAHSRLAELLLAAASILAEITASGGRTTTDVDRSRVGDSRQNALRTTDFENGAIFTERPSIGGNREQHVTGDLHSLPLTSSGCATGRHEPPRVGAAISHTDGAARENHLSEDDMVFQQRLPALTAFKAEGGDWGAFQRRFLAHQEMSGWSDATALRALPAMLDDNALAAFRSAPRSARSTLKAALGLMAKVYGPPSACRHQFYRRRKGDTETTLAYRTALLALADAAFPRMDEEGQDAMVMEQLLTLAQDLGVPINTADEVDICSLRVATSIQAHEVLKQKQAVVCASAAVSTPAPVDTDPQVSRPREEAFATARPGDWRSGGRSPLRSTRKLEQPKPATSLVTCYNCGLRGHVASGCRAPRQRATGPRLDDDQGPKSSQLPPVSRN